MITKSTKKTSKMAISKSTEAKVDLVGSELGYKIISMKKKTLAEQYKKMRNTQSLLDKIQLLPSKIVTIHQLYYLIKLRKSNAKNIEVMIPKYNILGCSGNFDKTYRSLYQMKGMKMMQDQMNDITADNSSTKGFRTNILLDFLVMTREHA